MKVSELSGAMLDYWVAKAGEEWKTAHQHFPTMTLDPTFSGVELRDYPRGEFGASVLTCVLIPRNPFRQDPQPFCPSIAWEQAGPIIERIGIMIRPNSWNGDRITLWAAFCYDWSHGENYGQIGETPLIAAMRSYVRSKFGDEVPDANS